MTIKSTYFTIKTGHLMNSRVCSQCLSCLQKGISNATFKKTKMCFTKAYANYEMSILLWYT